ncbi:hypothetical protein POF51_26055 [Brevibacillus sp. AG]|uniref:hypothetical protein n=1 Tax=Brevibacillus sp. AG TaxID=3020891 RepID=UPI0023312154|nr:hypothetical protein [Brevibacillus sp. AG]MDC0764188.1 hypothetical protein [Brevibacillus sp. AG]
MTSSEYKRQAINPLQGKYLQLSFILGFLALMVLVWMILFDYMILGSTNIDFMRDFPSLAYKLTNSIEMNTTMRWLVDRLFGVTVVCFALYLGIRMNRSVINGKPEWKEVALLVGNFFLIHLLFQTYCYLAFASVKFGEQLFDVNLSALVDSFNSLDLFSFPAFLLVITLSMTIGIGIIKFVRLFLLLCCSFYFPFTTKPNVSAIRERLVSLAMDGMRLVLDSLIGVTLVIVMIKTLNNAWHPGILLVAIITLYIGNNVLPYKGIKKEQPFVNG